MVKYKIIPYDRSHTDEILTFGMNDKLLENDASSEEGRIDYGIPGLSFTLLADNNIVLCGGITPLWDGVVKAGLSHLKEFTITKLNQYRQSKND